MKITIQTITCSKFEYNLKTPFKVGASQLGQRQGYHLQALTDQGLTGKGELSPLPGLHQESLEEAKTQLERALPLTFDPSLPITNQLPVNCFPSVQYALEECGINILQQKEPSQLTELFHLTPNYQQRSPAINALLIPAEDSYQQVKRLLRKWISSGITSVKIKVGRMSVGVERELLIKLISTARDLNTKLTFRLDGNQQMSCELLVALLHGLDLDLVEYLEEPLPDHNDHESLHHRLGLKWAIDESLANCLSNNTFPIGCTTWILKPRLIGSIHRTRQLITNANQRGYQTVISSCFESEVGMESLKLLAHLQNHSRPVAAGLDTLKEFRHLE